MSDSPTADRFVLISVNPKAGRKSPRLRAERLQKALEKLGFSVELHTDLAVVSARANELFAAGKLRVLVGVGGDGTAAELTNRTAPGTPITLLPSGTANLIAKYLKIPFNPEKMAQMIATGETIVFDAGKANGRLFLVMISAGIDAEIVRLVHAAREESYRRQTKKGAHISYLSYIKPIFRSVWSYRYPQIKTEIFGAPTDAAPRREIVGKWPFVFNLPRYGWGLPLVPKCVGVDGELDHCVFQGGKLTLALVDVAFAQIGSAHRILPNAKLGRGKSYRLSAADESADVAPIPYQLDGDPGGFLPLEIETIPNRLTFLAPAKVVAKLERARRR